MAAKPPRVIDLPDADATVALGRALARAVVRGAVFALTGELGAGKTTLARGFVNGLGHAGNVKSPTYTLIESYSAGDIAVHHIDLYRLADPEELEFLGIRELAREDAVLLVEWAGRGTGFLPPVDIDIALAGCGNGRRATLDARTARGTVILDSLVFPG